MRRRELPAAAIAILASLLLIVLIYVGSRGFRDFDSALIGYAVATVFAFAAVIYRLHPLDHPSANLALLQGRLDTLSLVE